MSPHPFSSVPYQSAGLIGRALSVLYGLFRSAVFSPLPIGRSNRTWKMQLTTIQMAESSVPYQSAGLIGPDKLENAHLVVDLRLQSLTNRQV